MADAEAKTHDEITVTCKVKGCGGSWPVSLPRGVQLPQWTTLLEEQRCPRCGAAYTLSVPDETAFS